MRLILIATFILMSTCFGDAGAAERMVKVGVVNNPPVAMVDSKGVPDGLAIDVIIEVARRNGWQVSFINDTWTNLLARLEAGEIDIQTGIAETEQRAYKFDFNNESLISNWGVLYRHADVAFGSVTDLADAKIAAVSGATHTMAFRALMRNFGVTHETIEVPTYQAAFDAVDNETADFAVVSRLYGHQNAKRFKVIETAMTFNLVEVKFAAPTGRNVDLLDQIDAYLLSGKAEKGSHYNQLLTKWLADPVVVHIPLWLTWVSLAGVAIVLLLVAALWWARRQVALQTLSLRHSQEKLVDAQCIARIGDFEWDLEAGEITWSVGMYRLLGYDPEEKSTLSI